MDTNGDAVQEIPLSGRPVKRNVVPGVWIHVTLGDIIWWMCGKAGVLSVLQQAVDVPLGRHCVLLCMGGFVCAHGLEFACWVLVPPFADNVCMSQRVDKRQTDAASCLKSLFCFVIMK